MEVVEVMTSFGHSVIISRSPRGAQQDKNAMYDSVRVNLCSVRSNIRVPKNVCCSIDECSSTYRVQVEKDVGHFGTWP